MSSGQLADFFRTIRTDALGLHVSGIHPTREDIVGRVYRSQDAEAAAAWLQLLNAKGYNCYWTPNAVDPPGEGKQYRILQKPKKQDIRQLIAFTADVDPELEGAGEEAYRSARQKLLNGRCTRIIDTDPTALIDSGNGLSPLWLLDAPVDATAETIAEFEQRNYTLLLKHKADPGTWNVERLVRAPFTVNYSSALKLAKGYPEQTNSRLLHVDPFAWVRFDEIQPTPIPQGSAVEYRAPQEPDNTVEVMERLMQALHSDDDLRRRWEGSTDGLQDQTRSGVDKSIAQVLKVRHGFSFDAFAHAVRTAEPPPAYSNYQDEKGTDRYLARKYEPGEGDPAAPADVFDTYTLSEAEDRAEQRAKAPPFQLRQIPETLLEIGALTARPYLYGKLVIRGTLSLLVGAGGVAKSMLALAVAVGAAIGRDLLGLVSAEIRPRKTLVLNNEDDEQEMFRRMAAVCSHYPLTPEEMAAVRERVILVPFNRRRLKLVGVDDAGNAAATGAMDHLATVIRDQGAEILVADPLVSLHDAGENDNSAMEEVVGLLRDLCQQCQIGAIIVHHARKGGTDNADSGPDNAARGASAVVNAARSNFMLSRMTPKEAKALGVEDDERPRFIRFDDGKANYSLPAGSATWLYLNSVPLQMVDDETGELVTQTIGVPSPAGDRLPTEEERQEMQRQEEMSVLQHDMAAVDQAARQQGGNTSATLIRDLTGLSRPAFENARAGLVKTGLWKPIAGGNGTRYAVVEEGEKWND